MVAGSVQRVTKFGALIAMHCCGVATVCSAQPKGSAVITVLLYCE